MTHYNTKHSYYKNRNKNPSV